MNVFELYDTYNVFDKEFGLRLSEDQECGIRYELNVSNKHLSSPGIGHGAVVASMMDAILGTRALHEVIQDRNLVSTVEYKTNYFKPIKLNDHPNRFGCNRESRTIINHNIGKNSQSKR